jgi:hypothetical protein
LQARRRGVPRASPALHLLAWSARRLLRTGPRARRDGVRRIRRRTNRAHPVSRRGREHSGLWSFRSRAPPKTSRLRALAHSGSRAQPRGTLRLVAADGDVHRELFDVASGVCSAVRRGRAASCRARGRSRTQWGSRPTSAPSARATSVWPKQKGRRTPRTGRLAMRLEISPLGR